MTLNGVALILHFSPNSIALLADYVTVVEDRSIMSVNIVSQFQSSTFGHTTLQRGLSAIAKLLVYAIDTLAYKNRQEERWKNGMTDSSHYNEFRLFRTDELNCRSIFQRTRYSRTCVLELRRTTTSCKYHAECRPFPRS